MSEESTTAANERVWDQVRARLLHDPDEQLNTFTESCGRWASDRGRLALIIDHGAGSVEHWTYYHLARAVDRAAAAFGALGLRRGDRVASVMTRQVEAWITALAAWRSGLVYVPLFCGFGDEALRTRLGASRAKAVVVDHRWRDTVGAALASLDQDVTVVTVGGGGGRGIVRGDVSFWAELDRVHPPVAPVKTSASDPATLMFTSGTTSTPKACVIPHSGFLSLIPFVEHVFASDTSDLLFATSDPGWSYGLYTSGCAPMSLGVPRITSTGDFDPGAWLRLMADHEVTIATGAPTAFRRLPAAARRYGWPDTLRAASTAGEALDAVTVEEFAKHGTGLRDGYGLTEVGMVLANRAGHEEGIDPEWLHGPVPGFEVELWLPDGTPADVGEDGVLAIRRPRFQLSTSYENAPDAWKARWQNGWYVTDDLFRRDDRGRFQFRGRADDVIVTSGYNVGPIEVESVLLADPAILEAAVVAQPDPERGAIVRAVVVPGSDAPERAALTARLQEAVKEQVGRHAYPRVIDYVDTLPRTATGKLRRTELREPGA